MKEELAKYMHHDVRNAVFQLSNDKYPEMRDKIVITENDNEVSVGVTAVVHVKDIDENGFLVIEPKNVGDYKVLPKTATLADLFNTLEEVYKSVKELARQVNSAREEC